MNRLQWNLKFWRYRDTKIINIVLAVLTLFQLFFGIYLLVPIVSPKIESIEYELTYDSDSKLTCVSIRPVPATKYRIKYSEYKIVIYDKNYDENNRWKLETPDHFWREQEIVFEYYYSPYNDTYPQADTYDRFIPGDMTIELTDIEVEGMTGDIIVMCFSFIGAILGGVFLINRLRAEKMLPSA